MIENLSAERLRIEPLGKISEVDWNEFVALAPEAWLWHRTDAVRALALWPGKRDLSFSVVNDSGKILAIFPLLLVTRGLLWPLTINRLESLGGPALHPGLSRGQRKAVFLAVFNRLKEIGESYRVWETNVSLSAMAPILSSAEAPRVNPLLEWCFENRMAQTWVIDLRGKSQDDIFRGYSETTRNEIRRLIKTDHSVREASGEKDFEIYYRLHCETYRRTGVRPHPRSYFDSIFHTFIPNCLSRILFFEKHGEVVAAQNTCFFKERAFYWTGASSAKRVGGESKVLCHYQILRAFDLGCEFFEVGEAFPDRRSGKAKGLSDFKRSFGGELFPLYRGCVMPEKRGRRFLVLLYECLKRAREA